MKFQKLLFLSFIIIIQTFTSCTSDDSSNTEEQIDPATQKLVSITYPHTQNIAYSMPDEDYEYDNLNRVNKLHGMESYAIKYLNDDLIEMDLTYENVSGVDIILKESFYLKDKKIALIIRNTVHKGTSNGEIQNTLRDSTVFTYTDEYISKTMHYVKNSYFSDKTYRLERQMDFEVTNGNITQLKTAAFGEVTTTNYTYDDNPAILMGDFFYETPLFLTQGYDILTHDKLGKKSKNNIIAIENVFSKTPFDKSYKKINIKRILDQQGRISEIILSGNCVTSNPVNVATDFTDEKIVFEYR